MRVTALFILFIMVAACSSTGSKHGTPRDPATIGQDMTEPVLKYFSYKEGVHSEIISPARWEGQNGGFSAGGRFDFLMKIYSANVRATSRRGQKHTACFDGQADKVAQAFFNKDNPHHQTASISEGVAQTKASADGKLLGVAFTAKLGKQTRQMFFRLPNCSAGKSSAEPTLSEASAGTPEGGGLQQRQIPGAILKGANIPHQLYGFKVFDEANNPKMIKVPKFNLKANYNDALPSDKDRPWRGMDVRSEKGAWELAVLAQKYVYEGMANQNANPNFNFIVEQNPNRFWCHMPWLNVGPSGREAVHGLTKERDLQPSPLMSLFRAAAPGTDWGVAIYNSFGCQSLAPIFGNGDQPKETADFSKVEFMNGTLTAKILFTTAEFDAIKNAFSWDANVSHVGETNRQVRSVRHIQMDIAIRDSSITGTNSDMNDWIMLTYYYDPNYDYDTEYKAATGKENPLKELAGLPIGFKKMRPMGIQTGLDEPSTGDSIIFKGAETNGVGGRLNGPADNPKSSCLSCHATAGTKAAMVPGFLKNEEFKQQNGVHMDFSQQVSLAKRNLETFISTQAGEN